MNPDIFKAGYIKLNRYSVKSDVALGEVDDIPCSVCDEYVNHLEIIYIKGQKFGRWICE